MQMTFLPLKMLSKLGYSMQFFRVSDIYPIIPAVTRSSRPWIITGAASRWTSLARGRHLKSVLGRVRKEKAVEDNLILDRQTGAGQGEGEGEKKNNQMPRDVCVCRGKRRRKMSKHVYDDYSHSITGNNTACKENNMHRKQWDSNSTKFNLI